jgi:hypothetical protein
MPTKTVAFLLTFSVDIFSSTAKKGLLIKYNQGKIL